MEVNNNIPNFNFISSLIKEKNGLIKENILLGNIHFPEKILYTPDSLNKSESHNIFINNLSSQLNREKIREEKNFLTNKIEAANNSIKNYLNKENYKKNNNMNFLPSLNLSNILPTIKEKNEKNNKEKFTRKKFLLEIKPLPDKRGNQLLIDKTINKENEYYLEQNARDFIRKINHIKINNITQKRQRQKKELEKLRHEIEIAEKRKQRQEIELQKRKEERKINLLKKQNNIYNNYSPQKLPKVKYHYYNSNNSAKKHNKMAKNFSYALNYNEFNYNFPYYNNNIFNNMNNNMINGYNYYPNINQYQYQYQQMMINNDIDVKNTDNSGIVNNKENNSNIIYRDSNNHSIINESRSNNNSILNTSEKKHLYYFNDLKYEN